MHEKRFNGDVNILRSAERLALLEVDTVVKHALADIEFKTVLDIGIGSGIFAEAFIEKGLKVTGIDVSMEMLEIARNFIPQATLLQMPAERMDFPQNSYDLVFMAHLLHETDQPEKVLSLSYKISTKRVAVLEWPYKVEDKGPPLHHRLKSETIISLAENAGFKNTCEISLKHMTLFIIDH